MHVIRCGQRGLPPPIAPPPKARTEITITIRPLLAEQIHARAAELHAIYRAAFAAPPYSEDESGAALLLYTLLDHSRKPGFRCFGAEPASGGPLLGVVYGYQGAQGDWWRERVAAALPPASAALWLDDCFEYAGFADTPTAQRQGLGAQLHDALLSGLPQRTAVLSTIQAATPAFAFYRAHGWITLREDYRFALDGPLWRLMGLCLPPPAPQRAVPAPTLAPGLRLRPFAPADQPAARQLILAGLGEHFGSVDETRNPDLDDIAATYLARGHVFLVVERAGVLVGTGALLVSDDAPTGQLVRMSVSRAERRHGIGRALVAALVAEAQRRDLRRLTVETNKDWYDAIGLYIASGFREDTLDEESIYLQLPLAPATP
jgi:ribosomal protein S18 acetylase RimI-like enzyme